MEGGTGVIAQATTTVDVYRDATGPEIPEAGQDFDEWGNEIETPLPDTGDDTDLDPDPLHRAVPASIIERERRIPDPDGNLVPVSFVVGRVGGDVDVRPGDRLLDVRHGGWYAVEDVTRPQNPAMMLDLRLELTKVG